MDHSTGDVIRATRRGRNEGYHYIVVWNDFNEGDDFIGIMLTTSSVFRDNIQMSREHFVAGNLLAWNESQHFVNRQFLKFATWGPFTKVGELTEVGINFISDNLQQIPPVSFDDYEAEHRYA